MNWKEINIFSQFEYQFLSTGLFTGSGLWTSGEQLNSSNNRNRFLIASGNIIPPGFQDIFPPVNNILSSLLNFSVTRRQFSAGNKKTAPGVPGRFQFLKVA